MNNQNFKCAVFHVEGTDTPVIVNTDSFLHASRATGRGTSITLMNLAYPLIVSEDLNAVLQAIFNPITDWTTLSGRIGQVRAA